MYSRFKKLTFLVIVLCTGLTTATPMQAQRLVIDFIDHEAVSLDVPWTEHGLEFVVTQNNLGFPVVVATQYGLTIGYADLTIDVTSLHDFRAAEVFVETYTVVLNTYVQLKDQAGVTLINEINTVTMEPEMIMARRDEGDSRFVVIGGLSLNLMSVTLEFGTVPTEQTTWSRLKTLYR